MPTVTSKKFSWFKKLTLAQQHEAWRERRRKFREENDAIASAASIAFADASNRQATVGAELAAQTLLTRVQSDLEAKRAEASKAKLDVSV